MGIVYSLWDRFVIRPLEELGWLTPREEKPRVIFRRRNFQPDSSSDSSEGGNLAFHYYHNTTPPQQANPNPPRQATPPVQVSNSRQGSQSQARRVKERRPSRQ